MEANAREARRKRLADRGADRLAFITGHRESIEHPVSYPKTPYPVQAKVGTSGADDVPSTLLTPKCELSTEAVVKPTAATPEVQEDKTFSILNQPDNTSYEANPVEPSFVMQRSESNSAIPNSSNKVSQVPDLSNIFSANRITSSLSETENIRLVCAVVLALVVVFTCQSNASNSSIFASFIACRPVILLLLTDITIVLGPLLNQGSNGRPEAGRASGREGDWLNNIGSTLEAGLVVQKAINAAFMDFSVYAVMLVSGLCLRQYFHM